MNQNSQDIDIDLWGVLEKIWQNKLWIILVAASAAVLFFLLFSSISPKYRSDARVLIENRESIFTRATTDVSAIERFDVVDIGSQVEFMRSDSIALKVIDSLGIAKHPEFAESSSSVGLYTLLELSGVRSAGEKEPVSNAILEQFNEQLSVFALAESRVIAVEFSSTDPKLARDVPNELVKQFTDAQKKSGITSTEDATDWLGPEVVKLRKRVQAAEAKVEQYRSTTDLLVGSDNALLATQQLSDISSELTRLRAERSQAEARLAALGKALKQGSTLDSVPEVMSSQIVQRLQERKLSLGSSLTDLTTTLLPNHPRIKALRSQIADLDTQIRSASSNILTSLRDNVDYTRQKESELVRELNRLKTESSRVSEAAVDLRALEREAQAERELLESYLRRLRQASSRTDGGYQPVNATQISRAALPHKAYFPKVVPFTIAGTLGVSILHVLGIIAYALLSGAAFKTKDEFVNASTGGALGRLSSDFEQAGGGNQLAGSLPTLWDRSDKNLRPGSNIDRPSHDQQTAELMRLTGGLFRLGKARVVVIAPDGDDEQTLAVMLSNYLAQMQLPTMLMDCSSSGQTTKQAVGDLLKPGIAHVLAGQAELDDVIVENAGQYLEIVPVGASFDGLGPSAITDLSHSCDILDLAYAFTVIDAGAVSADGIQAIARSDTIVLIDGRHCSSDECARLERELGLRGYQDINIVFKPTMSNQHHALAA